MRLAFVASASLLLLACGKDETMPPPNTPTATAAPTFEAEVAYLKAHGVSVDVLQSGTGQLAVVPGYQGRVMTSAVEPNGRSLGFVNHAFIDAGKTGTQFDNYGGEDRFWLGPEAGQWGLYFAPGAPYKFDLWQTPHGLQEGRWGSGSGATDPRVLDMVGHDAGFLSRQLMVQNHSGVRFDVEVSRRIKPVTKPPVTIGAGVKWVGFTSVNVVTNVGGRAWSAKDGMVSIWILGMFNPAPDAKIIVPFSTESKAPIVNDRYFGKIAPERLKVAPDESYVLLQADGQARVAGGMAFLRVGQDGGGFALGVGGQAEPGFAG